MRRIGLVKDDKLFIMKALYEIIHHTLTFKGNGRKLSHINAFGQGIELGSPANVLARSIVNGEWTRLDLLQDFLTLARGTINHHGGVTMFQSFKHVDEHHHSRQIEVRDAERLRTMTHNVQISCS